MRRRSTTSGTALDVLTTAGQVLVDAVPADVWCAVLLDPATLLDTGGQHEHGFSSAVMPRLFEIEHTEQVGVDQLRALARRERPAAVLSHSLRGRLDGSVYYRDVLRPEGLGDELRVVLRDGRRVWGLLVLCRANGAAPFTPDDVDAASGLSGPAAAALRRSLLLSGVDRGDIPDAPGMLVIGEDGRPLSATVTARELLATVQESGVAPGPPYALRAVAARARGLPVGEHTRARVRTRSGGWLTFIAWRMEYADGTLPVHVSVSRSQPGELAAIVLDAYGLSPREREVTQLVLLGRSGAEIAATLHITQDTVQDHLRKVFDKAGVRSRRDLVGELFLRHYLPQLSDPALTTDGRMRVSS